MTRIILQPFQPSYIPALVRLSAEAEAVDCYGFALDRRQLVESVQSAPDDFRQRCWLAFAEGGGLAGYLRAERSANNGQRGYWLHGVVHPAWRRQGVGTQLMQQAWSALRSGPERPAYALTWAYKDDSGRHALYAKFGLEPYHFYWEMTRGNLAEIPPPVWPAGVLLRPWDESQAEAVVALRNHVFAQDGDYQPISAARLCRHFRTGRFEPELAVIAWRGDRPVGFTHSCLAWTRRARGLNEGEIVWLAVSPDERGRGLGAALVLETMRRLRAAGAEVATVGVHTSAGATPRLYARLGFTPRQVVVDYRAEIR